MPLPTLRGLYTEHPSPAACATGYDLTPEEHEGLIEESECLMQTGNAERWGGREWYYQPTCYEDMSRRRINNLKKTIEARRPEWVERIKEAARAANEVHTIVGLAQMDRYPYPAVAIIENLRDRGEIFVHDD